jgi:hypothetical protein
MGTVESETMGHSSRALDQWAKRASAWAAGGAAADLKLVGPPAPAKERDVFVSVISGFKERNPAAAMALIERIG